MLLLLSACQNTTERMATPDFAATHIPFVRDGKTSRQEVTARLGQSTSSYEHDRILTYYVCEDDNKKLRLEGCQFGNNIYNLILVFDADGILNKHSLLRR